MEALNANVLCVTMIFSLRQLFASMFVFGTSIGIAVSNGRLGVGLSVAYFGITVALLFLLRRTIKTWRTDNFPRRVYGTVLSTLCLGLWLYFLANIIYNPTIHRTRVTANLQFSLRHDDRFESIIVEYVELKPQFLRVTGTLENEDDLALLRKMVSDRNWDNMDAVYWSVGILSTNRYVDLWDTELIRL